MILFIYAYVSEESGEMIITMKQSKKKAIYCIGMLLLFILIYVVGSYCLYGTIYSMFGSGSRHTWETEDLIEASENFQIQEDGTFLATAPDACFIIQESFGVSTIIIEIGKTDEICEIQFSYGSNYSDRLMLHKGANYLQLPEGAFDRIRIGLVQKGGSKLPVRRITAYGSRVVPSWFMALVIVVWAVLTKTIYARLISHTEKSREIEDLGNAAVDRTTEENISRMPNRIYSISYLRVIALGMILYDHLGAMRNGKWIIKGVADLIICTPLHVIQDFGALGVSLFYLLAGFLFIHSNRRKNKCIRSNCRKIARIYIFTVLSFATFWGFQWIVNQIRPTYWSRFSLKNWVGCATLINHFNGVGENVNGTTWFLIPLFLFYLLASVCCQIAKKNTVKVLIYLEGIMAVLPILGAAGSRLPVITYVSPLFPFVSIPVTGMIIYACFTKEISYPKGLGFGAFNYVMMTLSFYKLNTGYYADTSYIISFVYAVLLLIIFVAGERSFKRNRFIEFLGKISLSVYLVHMTWGGLFMSLLEPMTGFSLAFVCSLGLVIIVSWFHYALIENKLLKVI